MYSKLFLEYNKSHRPLIHPPWKLPLCLSSDVRHCGVDACTPQVKHPNGQCQVTPSIRCSSPNHLKRPREPPTAQQGALGVGTGQSQVSDEVLISEAHRVGFLQDSQKLFHGPCLHPCPNTQEWKGDLPPFFFQQERPRFEICLCHFLSWWSWENVLVSLSLKALHNTTGLHEIMCGKPLAKGGT